MQGHDFVHLHTSAKHLQQGRDADAECSTAQHLTGHVKHQRHISVYCRASPEHQGHMSVYYTASPICNRAEAFILCTAQHQPSIRGTSVCTGTASSAALQGQNTVHCKASAPISATEQAHCQAVPGTLMCLCLLAYIWLTVLCCAVRCA